MRERCGVKLKYHFYYDETEHSRKINYSTISAENYYDNFTSAIVGWRTDKEEQIQKKYIEFEEKYAFRKKNGELKSQTMRQKDFEFGFASIGKNSIGFYEDLISFFEEDIVTFFCVSSKIEYIIHQVFAEYLPSPFVDVGAMKYIIIKALITYKPGSVLKAMYESPKRFVDELSKFIKNRLEKNTENPLLKERENESFRQILIVLDEVKLPDKLEWLYTTPFDGFSKLMNELNIPDYELIIDREGRNHNTLNAANEIGLLNCREEDSTSFCGLRAADMFAGLISRLMQAISSALKNDYSNSAISKTLLVTGWFSLNDTQLRLYKKLYKVLCVNKPWYSSYAGIYADDLIAFIAFVQFINEFDSVGIIAKEQDKLPEYFNTYACKKLDSHFGEIRKRFTI